MDRVRALGSARYGLALTPNLHMRIYGTYSNRDSLVLSSGRDAHNKWQMSQGGFRVDWAPSIANLFTLQGDVYEDRLVDVGSTPPGSAGANVIGRWAHVTSRDSDVNVQFYSDRTHRNIPGAMLRENRFDEDAPCCWCIVVASDDDRILAA
jgi:iron complex outermembrane receptor protein